MLASSETLIDALQRAVRYSTIMNEGILQTCIDGKHFGFSLDYVGVSRHPDRHQIEFVVTVMVRTCRQLTGSRVVPERVRIVHHRTQRRSWVKFSATTSSSARRSTKSYFR